LEIMSQVRQIAMNASAASTHTAYPRRFAFQQSRPGGIEL